MMKLKECSRTFITIQIIYVKIEADNTYTIHVIL